MRRRERISFDEARTLALPDKTVDDLERRPPDPKRPPLRRGVPVPRSPISERRP